MRPSEWLRDLEPDGVYAVAKVYELIEVVPGIRFNEGAGVLMVDLGLLRGGLPTGNVLRHFIGLTPRQVMSEAAQMGYEVGFDEFDDSPADGGFILGFQLTEAIWMLVRDIRMDISPASVALTPQGKHAACLRALERIGL